MDSSWSCNCSRRVPPGLHVPYCQLGTAATTYIGPQQDNIDLPMTDVGLQVPRYGFSGVALLPRHQPLVAPPTTQTNSFPAIQYGPHTVLTEPSRSYNDVADRGRLMGGRLGINPAPVPPPLQPPFAFQQGFSRRVLTPVSRRTRVSPSSSFRLLSELAAPDRAPVVPPEAGVGLSHSTEFWARASKASATAPLLVPARPTATSAAQTQAAGSRYNLLPPPTTRTAQTPAAATQHLPLAPTAPIPAQPAFTDRESDEILYLLLHGISLEATAAQFLQSRVGGINNERLVMAQQIRAALPRLGLAPRATPYSEQELDAEAMRVVTRIMNDLENKGWESYTLRMARERMSVPNHGFRVLNAQYRSALARWRRIHPGEEPRHGRTGRERGARLGLDMEDAEHDEAQRRAEKAGVIFGDILGEKYELILRLTKLWKDGELPDIPF